MMSLRKALTKEQRNRRLALMEAVRRPQRVGDYVKLKEELKQLNEVVKQKKCPTTCPESCPYHMQLTIDSLAK